ncbi:MAG: hypothetical protein LiPW15_708 [Parcubacteria group bacterium LiPW_15]|nr:MAG: hypothetical protein LiPW15_708 [Parcubacteria group bacterium LiPW_15]
MLLFAVADFGIYYLPTDIHNFSVFLMLLAILHSFGNQIYWAPSNAIFFNALGSLDSPGKYSGIMSIVEMISATLAGVAGLLLSDPARFLYLWPLGGTVLLLSILPLLGLHISFEDHLSTIQGFKKLSLSAILANINPDHRFQITAIPLLLVFLFKSLNVSIWITGITFLASVLISYIAGRYKDSSRPFPYIIATISLGLMWILYAFAKTPLIFILLGVGVQLASLMLDVGREARLGREVVNSGNPLNTAFAIECSRAIGGTISFSVLLVVYLIYGPTAQLFLALGVIFILPRARYAIGNIDGALHSPRA